MSNLIHNLEILHIFISPGHDFKGRHGHERLNHGSQSVDSVECVSGRGLEGDRFFDYREDFKGQVTFFELKVADTVERLLGLEDFELSQLRRNVIVSGVDLNELIGKRFEINGAEFFGSEECSPCYWMNEALGPGAEALLKDRGGLRCRILSSGNLRLGEIPLKVVL
jgi:MOSC domain-containing protein YiiM